MKTNVGTTGPSRWTVLWVIFVARTSMGYQFQSIGSVGPVLVEHLAINFTMLGTLIGLYKFPGLFLAYPSGLLGRRFGLKSIAVLGLFLMAAGGLVTAFADTYFLITTGRVVAGTGAVIFNVLSAAIVANWFEDKELTLAMAIHVNSWPFGIALGLATQAVLLEATSLEVMMLLTALFCAIGWLLLFVLDAEPQATVSSPVDGAAGEDSRSRKSCFFPGDPRGHGLVVFQCRADSRGRVRTRFPRCTRPVRNRIRPYLKYRYLARYPYHTDSRIRGATMGARE